jgi:hypothetical protein
MLKKVNKMILMDSIQLKKPLSRERGWGETFSFAFIAFAALLSSCSFSSDGGKSDTLLAMKSDSLPEVVDYNIHIRPILSDKCFNCHGPDKNKREAGLRLDNIEAYDKIEGRRAIIPNHPERSETMIRIFSEDPENKMPLPASNLSLTDLEKAMIAKWIKQGAAYKPHWAFISPEKYKVPAVHDKSWGKTPIDNFILAKIEMQGLKPSLEASKNKLARRLAFDLTGLPPSDQSLDSFLTDNSPKAYEKLVDKLLASPHYGERVGMEWLDVARYADSHGYQDDGESEMWPWRDWVIKAFNLNMPYNQFITWQMAGDLMLNKTKEQILATGFNRNHMINAEGGIIDEEFRTEYVLDRVNTTTKAFLAMTAECARCHDHKYDPISQKEFYSMAAFFNQMNEHGVGALYENGTGPTLLLTDDKTDEQLKFIREKIKLQETKVSDVLKSNVSQSESLKAKLLSDNGLDKFIDKSLVAYFNFDNKDMKDSIIHNLINEKQSGKLNKTSAFLPGYSGNALAITGDEAPTYNGNELMNSFEKNEPFSVSMWIKAPKPTAKGFTLMANNASTYHAFRGYEFLLDKGRLCVRLVNSWPSNALRAISKDSIPVGKWQHVAFTYDGTSKAEGIRFFVNGKETAKTITHNDLYSTIKTHTVEEDLKKFREFEKTEKKRPLTLIESKKKRQLEFKAFYSKAHRFSIGDQREQGVPPFFDGLIDELKVFNRDLSDPEMTAIYSGKSLKETLSKQKFPNTALSKLYLDYANPEWQQENANLKEMRTHELKLIMPLRQIKVMKDRPELRETFILDRGNYDAPTVTVGFKAIDAILPYADTLPKNRLGFAKWLVDPRNPLVARVTVNRYWQMLFGTGLVSSSSDFGNQGNMPSNPELLDWLSINFVESGWNVKQLIKQLVMSSTYRQTSDINPETFAKDPQNIFLARSTRYRMPYEMIRDNALAASGLLNPVIGGASFKPYQPKGLWEEKTESPVNNYYEEDKAPEIYRRSMYIFIKRTSPHPAFNTFDGPERYICQIKRQATNTPLQALTALNDPQMFETSRVLAQRMLSSKEKNMKDQIRKTFKKIISHDPSDTDLAILEKSFKSAQKKFQNRDKASKYLNVGAYPIDKRLNISDLAALTLVTSTIMNLDEALCRE